MICQKRNCLAVKPAPRGANRLLLCAGFVAALIDAPAASCGAGGGGAIWRVAAADRARLPARRRFLQEHLPASRGPGSSPRRRGRGPWVVSPYGIVAMRSPAP